MKLVLMCRCGSTEFSYVADDTYQCKRCNETTIVTPSGVATLEVDFSKPAYCTGNDCETCDEYICCHCPEHDYCNTEPTVCDYYQEMLGYM